MSLCGKSSASDRFPTGFANAIGETAQALTFPPGDIGASLATRIQGL